MRTKLFKWTLVFILSAPGLVFAQHAVIQGTVTNAETGESLPGASVMIMGTFIGAATGADGHYSIDRVSPGTYRVEVRFVGFRTMRQEVTATAGDVVVVNFELRPTALPLDDIVVTGQAREVARREVAASITSIDAMALAEAPVTSMSQLLQAREPGILVEQGGGNAGQQSRILLRGITSISMGAQPAIYVDGILIDNSPDMGVSAGGIAWSGLDDINWADVERVEVIKGAAAATLYGSAASAGIIQIFTKRARDPRPTTWTYQTSMGSNRLPERQLRDMGVYADWFLKGSYRLTLDEDTGEVVRWVDPETGEYYWYDPIARNGFFQQHHLSAHGMVGGFQYYSSVGYKIDQGPYINNQEELLSLRANVQFLPRPDLVMRVQTGLMERQVDFPQDGNNIYSYLTNGLTRGPRDLMYEIEKLEVVTQSRRFQTSISSEYTPADFFTGRLIFGADIVTYDNTELRPWGTPFGYPLGRKDNFRRNSRTGTVDAAGTFRVPFLQGNLNSTLTIGFQGIERKWDGSFSAGWDFPVPGLTTIEAAAVTEGNEYRRLSRFYGFYLQERVGLYDMVYLTAGVRADRHSSFGIDFGWGFYPSVGISYVISEHTFWPIHLGELRLRSQYGTAGQPPALFDPVKTWVATSALDGQPAVTTGRLGDPKLGPEVQEEIEIGFDWSILRDRMNFDVTYYSNSVRDALLPVLSPPSEGFLERQRRNVAQLENKGWEIAVGGNILNFRNFNWDAKVNFSYNQNEITQMPEEIDILPFHWAQQNIEGYPIVAYFGDRIIVENDELKMWSQSEAIKNKYPDAVDPETGDVIVGDLPAGWNYIGPAFPVRGFQLLSNINFLRNFNINVLFDNQSGHYVQSSTYWDLNPRRIGANDPIFPDKQGWPVSTWGWEIWEDLEALQELFPDDWSDMLQDPSTYTEYFRNPVEAAMTLGLPFGRPMGNEVIKADFWRLRELTVSYSIPPRHLARFGFSNASVYFTGRNLWVSHDTMTTDPETNYLGSNDYSQQEFGIMPLLRQYYFGLRVTF